MCLAVPGKLLRFVDIDAASAEVEFGGVVKTVCMAYVPEARPGDYVIVHVGFAIARLDEARAQRSLETIAELARYQSAAQDQSTAQDQSAAQDDSTQSVATLSEDALSDDVVGGA